MAKVAASIAGTDKEANSDKPSPRLRDTKGLTDGVLQDPQELTDELLIKLLAENLEGYRIAVGGLPGYMGVVRSDRTILTAGGMEFSPPAVSALINVADGIIYLRQRQKDYPTSQ